MQSAILTLTQSDNDFKFNPQSEMISQNIKEILNLKVFKLTNNFQNALRKRAKDIKISEEKRAKLSYSLTQSTGNV